MFGLRETLVCVCLCVLMIPGTDGHARLVEPPMRSSMWRFGFNVSINYNDNELFCGGLAVRILVYNIAFVLWQWGLRGRVVKASRFETTRPSLLGF